MSKYLEDKAATMIKIVNLVARYCECLGADEEDIFRKTFFPQKGEVVIIFTVAPYMSCVVSLVDDTQRANNCLANVVYPPVKNDFGQICSGAVHIVASLFRRESICKNELVICEAMQARYSNLAIAQTNERDNTKEADSPVLKFKGIQPRTIASFDDAQEAADSLYELLDSIRKYSERLREFNLTISVASLRPICELLNGYMKSSGTILIHNARYGTRIASQALPGQFQASKHPGRIGYGTGFRVEAVDWVRKLNPDGTTELLYEYKESE